MNTEKNNRWIEGIKNQDRRILVEIYDNILPGITAWVKQNNGTEDDAKDLFQDMIVSVYKKCKTGEFELTCTFWSYALIVCRNLWFAKNRNRDKMVFSENIKGEEVIIEEDMQYEIEKQEEFRLYRKHFDQLGEGCREILSMFFSKIQMSEIAEKLNLSPAYVKKRKFKCKEELINNIRQDEIYNELIS